MEQRYSQYTVEQLREEVKKLKEQAQKAEQLGNVSEYAVYQRKMQLAAAYMMNPADYKKGDIYKIEGDPGQTFQVDYINGVFAWGHRYNLIGQKLEKEEALPISLLQDKA